MLGVGFFGNTEGFRAELLEALGASGEGEGKQNTLVGEAALEALGHGGEIGIAGNEHGDIQFVIHSHAKHFAGDGNVCLFFLVSAHPAVDFVAPDALATEFAKVCAYSARGQGSDKGFVTTDSFRVPVPEVFGVGGEVMHRGELGTAANLVQVSFTKARKVQPLELGFGELFFGFLQGMVEIETINEENCSLLGGGFYQMDPPLFRTKRNPANRSLRGAVGLRPKPKTTTGLIPEIYPEGRDDVKRRIGEEGQKMKLEN